VKAAESACGEKERKVNNLKKTTILVGDRAYIRMKKRLAGERRSFSQWVREKMDEELNRGR
jgi:hypothetical protein